MAFSLGHLLDLELGLQLLVGDDANRRRRVVGAHAIELERPAAWLDRDWVVLTNGLRLHDRPDLQEALVGDLVGAGVAAIGFGLGVPYESPPGALLAEAERLGLPVFSVHVDTPFREVIRAVQSAQSDTASLELQRLSAMQLQLMQAVGSPEPRSGVVRRLAELLDSTVLLLSAQGVLLERAGGEPPQGVWQALGGLAGPVARTALDEREVTAVPLQDGASAGGWLAVVSPPRRPPVRLTRPAMRAAAPLLAALARMEAVVAGQERAIRRALLEELLEGAPAGELELRARAAQFGVALGDLTRVVMAEAHGLRAPADMVEGWEAILQAAGAPHLTAGDPRNLISLVACDPALLSDMSRRLFTPAGYSVGIGRVTSRHVAGVARSLREARLAAFTARPGTETAVVQFDDLDLATYVTGLAAAENVGPLVDAVLAPLKEQPHLLETLRTWMAHDCDVSASAATLCLRPNSVRYRLRRIEGLLGRPLGRPSTIASLHVALALDWTSPDIVESG